MPRASAAAESPPPGLRWLCETDRWLRRVRRGRSFVYVGPRGMKVTNVAVLRRIRALVIPPAWTEVWICPHASGHIQATGRDAKGRKQYRYHPEFRRHRDQAKFERLVGFGRALPRIRARVEQDLARRRLGRRKVLAAVVALLDETLIRIGNEEYRRTNRSHGLTTLLDQHVALHGTAIRFAFTGKSGRRREVTLRDRRLAAIVRRCRDLPGQALFQYVDRDGVRQAVDSGAVNAYLRRAAGAAVTAKDFRTWGGTVVCAERLARTEPPPPAMRGRETPLVRRRLRRALEEVAERLGNTVAVCRAFYVHPAVLEAYVDGTLQRTIGRPRAGLDATESAVLALLESRRPRAREKVALRRAS